MSRTVKVLAPEKSTGGIHSLATPKPRSPRRAPSGRGGKHATNKRQRRESPSDHSPSNTPKKSKVTSSPQDPVDMEEAKTQLAAGTKRNKTAQAMLEAARTQMQAATKKEEAARRLRDEATKKEQMAEITEAKYLPLLKEAEDKLAAAKALKQKYEEVASKAALEEMDTSNHVNRHQPPGIRPRVQPHEGDDPYALGEVELTEEPPDVLNLQRDSPPLECKDTHGCGCLPPHKVVKSLLSQKKVDPVDLMPSVFRQLTLLFNSGADRHALQRNIAVSLVGVRNNQVLLHNKQEHNGVLVRQLGASKEMQERPPPAIPLPITTLLHLEKAFRDTPEAKALQLEIRLAIQSIDLTGIGNPTDLVNAMFRAFLSYPLLLILTWEGLKNKPKKRPAGTVRSPTGLAHLVHEEYLALTRRGNFTFVLPKGFDTFLATNFSNRRYDCHNYKSSQGAICMSEATRRIIDLQKNYPDERLQEALAESLGKEASYQVQRTVNHVEEKATTSAPVACSSRGGNSMHQKTASRSDTEDDDEVNFRASIPSRDRTRSPSPRRRRSRSRSATSTRTRSRSSSSGRGSRSTTQELTQ